MGEGSPTYRVVSKVYIKPHGDEVIDGLQMPKGRCYMKRSDALPKEKHKDVVGHDTFSVPYYVVLA